jgi:predicted aspartyl protease
MLVALVFTTASFAAAPELGAAPVASGEQRPVQPTGEAGAREDEPLYASPTRRDRIGRIMAPVMINGQGPFRFVIDTGATHSVMSAELVRRLGLVPSAGPGVVLRGVTGSAVVATVQVEQLQAGDLIMRNHMMPIVGSVLSGADGVLGTLGLDDKMIIVDFAHDRIQIRQSRSSISRSGYLKVPVKLGFNSLLLADGYVGSMRVKAIIDTGAERTLGNVALRKALNINTDPLNTRALIDVQGVTAETQPGYQAIAPMIRLGDMNVTRVTIAFGEMHVFDVWGLTEVPAVLIGMDVLGTLDAIVIDYARKEVQFKPQPGPPILRLTR